MSYTPSFLVNHEQLIKYNLKNDNLFEWQYYPFDDDSPIKIINYCFPFSVENKSLVKIREIEFAYIPTEFSYQKDLLISFFDENNIEYYFFGS